MKFVLYRHMVYMFIAVCILGTASAMMNWLEGKGNIHLFAAVLNALGVWWWVHSSFEYFVWKKTREEKKDG